MGCLRPIVEECIGGKGNYYEAVTYPLGHSLRSRLVICSNSASLFLL